LPTPVTALSNDDTQPTPSSVSLSYNDPATWKSLSNAEREYIVLRGPPKNPSSFPRDSHGRCFPNNVFNKTLNNGEKAYVDWLVWSCSTNKLFCFSCCLFHNTDGKEGMSLLASTDGGIKDNWRKLYDQVRSHERNSVHVSRYLNWKSLETAIKEKKGVDDAIQRKIDAETAKWREILKCILDVILFLAERNLPLRGSSSRIGDEDNGLFLGMLELLSKHNKMLEVHLAHVKQHQDAQNRMQAHYLSWSSQNEFLNACGKQVLDALLQESKKAMYYSIIVDATPDVSHTEQISFVLRYVHRSEENVWAIKERFLLFKDCEKKKGKDIADLLCRVLEENEIDIQLCRGQGYDNGSNMAGIYNGVQALIMQKNPQAVYLPCCAHSLNLCGVHAVESSTVVKSFFGNIQKLYNFFSSSPSRWKVLQDNTGISLHRLSDTRWSARIDAIKPLVKRPREIMASLKTLKEDFDLPGDLYNDVTALLTWFLSFEYVVLATFWFKALQAINDVSCLLQGTQLTLDEEIRLFTSLVNDLQRIRESWSTIIEESRIVAVNLGFEEMFKQKRQRRQKIFHDEDRRNVHEHATEEDKFRVEVFYAALDKAIQEISVRAQKAKEINNRFSFIWNWDVSADATILKAVQLAKFYPRDINADDIAEETRHMASIGKELFGKVSSLELLNLIYKKGLQNIFPQTCIALRIFITIPVSVAEGERFFSKLAIVKNCLRSTMKQDRLSSLVLLSCEHDLAKSLNYDKIIDAFASSRARRIQLS